LYLGVSGLVFLSFPCDTSKIIFLPIFLKLLETRSKSLSSLSPIILKEKLARRLLDSFIFFEIEILPELLSIVLTI